MMRWAALGLLACGLYACTIQHRSDAYACTDQSDCSGGRMCIESFCVVAPDAMTTKTECNDGTDNDRDGLVDTADPGCMGGLDTSEHSNVQCDDGKDNDADGTSDFTPAAQGGDPGCMNALDDNEKGGIACDDGIDNDSDGKIDYVTNPSITDPGCTGPSDNSEHAEGLACDDGLDNDCDGRTDYVLEASKRDPGCQSLTDTNEHGTAQCDDGVDNDMDGRVDFRSISGCGLGDLQCSGPLDNNEQF